MIIGLVHEGPKTPPDRKASQAGASSRRRVSIRPIPAKETGDDRGYYVSAPRRKARRDNVLADSRNENLLQRGEVRGEAGLFAVGGGAVDDAGLRSLVKGRTHQPVRLHCFLFFA